MVVSSEWHHSQHHRAHQPNIWPSSSFCFISSSSGTTFSFAVRPAAWATMVHTYCMHTYTAIVQQEGRAV